MKDEATEASILLVEDSEDDAFFFRRALLRSHVQCQLHQVNDGAAAMVYLWENQARPHLVFLDLKIPMASGFEVLRWIKNQPFKSHLEVVVLSGSAHDHDIQSAAALGASAYLVKPLEAEALQLKVAEWGRKQTGAIQTPTEVSTRTSPIS